jgi:hypothetical protein
VVATYTTTDADLWVKRLLARHLKNSLPPLFGGPVFARRNPSLVVKMIVLGIYDNETRSGMNDVKPVFPNHNGAVVVYNWSYFTFDFADICKYVL